MKDHMKQLTSMEMCWRQHEFWSGGVRLNSPPISVSWLYVYWAIYWRRNLRGKAQTCRDMLCGSWRVAANLSRVSEYFRYSFVRVVKNGQELNPLWSASLRKSGSAEIDAYLWRICNELFYKIVYQSQRPSTWRVGMISFDYSAPVASETIRWGACVTTAS